MSVDSGVGAERGSAAARLSAEDRLLAIEEIRELKARYFRCMDTKDWEGLATIFAHDATFDATDSIRDGSSPDTAHQKLPDWHYSGGKAIFEFIKGVVTPLVTVHHGHVPEVKILSATTAEAVWPMEDRVREIQDGVVVREFHGFGHYWETYVRANGQWRIKTSKITRLRVDFLTGAPAGR
jgi:hypothetical protein